MKLQKKAIDLIQAGGVKVWCVTGAAGFIGSNIIEALLSMDQIVIGIDDYSTGKNENIEYVLDVTHGKAKDHFLMIKASVLNKDEYRSALKDVDILLHNAAKVSVSESILNPLETTNTNVIGFLNLLEICKEFSIKVVYASSSSIYGNTSSGKLGINEGDVGEILSPYGISKKINEIHANYYSNTNNMVAIGLRYFNVYGDRQNPDGEYAGVIAKWLSLAKAKDKFIIYGDGSNTRDFCHVSDVVSANILAAFHDKSNYFNIGSGKAISIIQLAKLFNELFVKFGGCYLPIEYQNFREGEIKHSLANISLANNVLGYEPCWDLNEGLKYLLGNNSEEKMFNN